MEKYLLDIRRPYLVLVIVVNIKDRSQDLCYLPDKNIWVKRIYFRKNKNKNISYRTWFIDWYLFSINLNIDDSTKYRLLAKDLYPNRLQNTVNYISKQLKTNLSYSCDFWCTKEDIVDQYYRTREENSIPIYDYRFSSLPNFLKNTRSIFTIFCNEINPKTGEVVGEVKTNYSYFIQHCQDGKILGSLKASNSKRITDDEFFLRAKTVHGNLYEYPSRPSTDRDSEDRILITCTRCGKSFLQNIRSHLSGQGCPTCNNKWEYKGLENVGRKKIPFEIFEKISKEKHLGRYEYVESSYTKISDKVTIIDTITGDVFEQQAYAHSRGEGNPNLIESRGELCIKNWLLQNSIEYTYNKSIQVEEYQCCRKTIRPDFQIEYLGENIWIEYNGIQHYRYFPKIFHKKGIQTFQDQLERDKFIESYCKNNNIRLIIIPYTYSNYEDIDRILTKYLLDKNDEDLVIKYPKVQDISSCYDN